MDLIVKFDDELFRSAVDQFLRSEEGRRLILEGQRLLYRVEEAAVVLGLGRSKVYELIARGELATVKIDGSTRIARVALETYVESLSVVQPERLG